MSSFTEDLIVSPLPDGRRWRLVKGFSYYLDEENKVKITVPESFVTDFASVPRVFWIIMPPHGKYTKASVIHDYLYHTGLFSRTESDKIFYDAMIVLNANKIKAYLAYLGARLVGGYFYRGQKWKGLIKGIFD